jgi:hypothetical protein
MVTEDPPLVATSCNPHFTSRIAFGRHMLIMGVHQCQMVLLHRTDGTSQQTGIQQESELESIRSSFIQDLWAAQLDFGRDYQAARHQPTTSTPDTPSPHVQEIRESIQHKWRQTGKMYTSPVMWMSSWKETTRGNSKTTH